MQISNFVLFGAIEAYVVLIAVCVFLLMHTRGLKKLIKRLQEKLETLVLDLRKTKTQFNELQTELDPSNAYKKQINDQLLITREYHQSLNPGCDIALDLSTESPLPRQAAAFRHAVLIAEKEALHSSASETPNWDALQQRLVQLIQFYQGSNKGSNDSNNEVNSAELESLQTELDNAKKRIQNLEKFKKLFFDMENQWQEAKSQAQEYYEQLSSMAGSVDDKESYEDILGRYNQVYDQVGSLIESGSDRPGSRDTLIIEKPAKTIMSTIEITKQDTRALSELKELRSVTADQHRLITELQRKLNSAETVEEKDNLIAGLNQELERQARFLNESETCMQLLEDELSTAMRQVSELQSQLENLNDEIEHLPRMKSTIHQFTQESKEMLKGLSQLERENEQLLAQNTQGAPGDPAQLALMQQELTTLQTQYAELEERYLELRMNS